MSNAREFEFTYRNFTRIVFLISEFSGINLTEKKVDMVYGRLARRLRKLKLDRFEDYLDLVCSSGSEKEYFINALTTNLTHFFREKHHFEYLERDYLPELINAGSKRIRFWSAGCSTGEEAYTLSMIWQALSNKPANIDFKILATDLNTHVLESCRDGVYSTESIQPVDKQFLKWFKPANSIKEGLWEISSLLAKDIYFKQLNLNANWPMKGPFDLIICRNVLIYFNKVNQDKLVERFYELLSENGCLMLGHSESLSTNRALFKQLGKTIYRKVG